MNFKEFLQEGVGPTGWTAKKDDLINWFQNLQPFQPMSPVRVIPADHRGSTYRYDGIRVTGSLSWIKTIVSRIKEILAYENDKTRLQPVFKQQIDNKTQLPIPNSYVFYVQVKDRQTSPNKIKPIKNDFTR